MKRCIVCDNKTKKWFHSHVKLQGTVTLLSQLKEEQKVHPQIKTGYVCASCAREIPMYITREKEKSEAQEVNRKIENAGKTEDIRIRWKIKQCKTCKPKHCCSCMVAKGIYHFDTSSTEVQLSLGIALEKHGMAVGQRGHVCDPCIDTLDMAMKKKMVLTKMTVKEGEMMREFKNIRIKTT